MTTVLRTGNEAAKGRQQTDRKWELFVDWCAATERSSLPADPATVAGFLADLPAGPATTARRVRAIDAAHRDAGLAPPGESPELDEALGRHPAPPRFDPAVVARALQAIPVGGWPAGIVGRRDAAVVALICCAGLTRTQVQALRTGAAQSPPLGSRRAGQANGGVADDPAETMAAVSKAEEPGSCPACALSRWLRVATGLERSGWRAVRAELADLGEIPAGTETVHDCARPFAWPSDGAEQRFPLFCAIDRHGAPETGWAISTRAITAIVAGRLSQGEQTRRAGWADEADEAAANAVGGERLPWGPEQRRRAAQHFAEVETTLDEMEAAADAILARAHAAMGDGLPGRQQG